MNATLTRTLRWLLVVPAVLALQAASLVLFAFSLVFGIFGPVVLLGLVPAASILLAAGIAPSHRGVVAGVVAAECLALVAYLTDAATSFCLAAAVGAALGFAGVRTGLGWLRRTRRWLLFVPAALAVQMLAYLPALIWADDLADPARIAGSVLGSGAALYLGIRIAPSRRRLAAGVLALVLLPLFAVGGALPEALARLAAMLGAAFLALRPGARLGRERAAAAEAGDRRYKGTAPFQDSPLDRRIFFGREREARSLLHLVLAERLVVVFARSGMGKSSLIQAGLVEPLRERGFLPLAVRLSQPDRSPIAALLDGVRQATRDARVDCVVADGTDAWSFFKTAEFWSPQERLLRPVLVLDQFEELFTLHRREARQEFIARLAELVRGRTGGAGEAGRDADPPELKIVLALREDFLADLEELARDIPGIFQHRFRLGPLRRDAARAAIVEPARLADPAFATASFAYREEAVDQIIAFLSRRRQGAETVESEEVEPVHLQLVCQYLEEQVRHRRGAAGSGPAVEISTADLGGERHLHEVLEGFYDRTLAAVASPLERRAVRRLCEKRLISGAGRRLTEDEEEIARRFAIGRARLAQLVDARLLRAEPRLGGTFYELAHDRLVAPVLRSRQRRLFLLRADLAGALALVVAASAIWWIATGQRELADENREAAWAQVTAGVPDYRDPSEAAFQPLAAAKLERIAALYPEWVGSPAFYGAMAHAVEDVGLRYASLRPRADALAGEMRAAFVAEHRLEPPTADEDARLNRRIAIVGATFVRAPSAAGGGPAGGPGGERRDRRDERYRREFPLEAFAIQEHAVTRKEFARFDSKRPLTADEHQPVGDVSWHEAMAYAAWLGGSLPSEAQWEAAKNGSPGEAAGDRIREWCRDWFADERRQPLGPAAGDRRLVRGAWSFDMAGGLDTGHRDGLAPRERAGDLGFRVVFPVASGPEG